MILKGKFIFVAKYINLGSTLTEGLVEYLAFIADIRNPSRNNISKTGKHGWYYYYAGYSPSFVEDILNFLKLPRNAVIMDPWNGSGTTTQVAQDMGYTAIGFDINPVMIIVAKARNLGHEVAKSLARLGEDIVKKARKYELNPFTLKEPLETWFVDNSAKAIRGIEVSIQKLLIDSKNYNFLCNKDLDVVSSLAAFFYVALFRTIKSYLSPFRSSNPTWIKIPKSVNNRISIDKNEIYETFLDNILLMTNSIDANNKTLDYYNKTCILKVAPSDIIPLSNNSVNAIITSPPYCTRIDYVIATLPELTLLGFTLDKEIKNLRNQMIGTPTISKKDLELKNEWGTTCSEFLKSVGNHQSKASNSYYYKNYLQYFHSTYNSLTEINRTLKKLGYCILVLQDSYYKELHLDLIQIISEMGYSLAWQLQNRIDFPKKQILAGINKNTGRYRTSVKATESILIFQKIQLRKC